MAASLILREQTAAAHDRVDAAFGGHDLRAARDYRRFLTAHALALPAAEAELAAHPALPTWSPRTPALRGDLEALGVPLPRPLAMTPLSAAGAWGLLYVVEGSRLGGALLARQVADGLPTAYLSAGHAPGGWRALRGAIDAAGMEGGPAWIVEAVAGAQAGFALYARAAAAH